MTHALDLTVAQRENAADDIIVLDLMRPNGGRLPDWTPGAHITLDLPPGPRCYSLCGDRWVPDRYRIAVHLSPHGRGGSAYIHDTLTRGAKVLATPPVNNFPVVPSSDYLFIAGGIGITPFIPMIDHAIRAGADWKLIYGARSRTAMAFLDALAPHHASIDLCPTDETGLLDLPHILRGLTRRTALYVCGPEPLIAAVHDHIGPDGPRVHSELFARQIDPQALAARFEVILNSDGRRLTVPAERTLFDVLAEAGLTMRGACLQGICGSCRTGVLDGEVDARDLVRGNTTQPASSVIFPCVSRAKTPVLTLDL